SAEADYDVQTQRAAVKKYGYRLGIHAFAPFFEILNDNGRVDALTAIYNPLAAQYGIQIQGRMTKAAMESALREFEEAHPEHHVQIKSEDQFYGFRGTNKLKPFLQYIYLPAVKDAADEELEARTGVLSSLVTRIVRAELNLEQDLDAIQKEAMERLATLFDGNKDGLHKLSARLTELAKNLFPELNAVEMTWNRELESQVRVDAPLVRVNIDDKTFSGPVSKFGHGIQRSYILALLQLFAETSTDNTSAKIIFACEEPELYQHPPQARHLAEALLQISKKHGQVLATTHSPYFISGENFSALRLLKARDKKVSVKSTDYNSVSIAIADAKQEAPHKQSAVYAGLIQKLQPPLNEIFFARFAVLVEGPEDIAYLRTQFDLRDKWTKFLSLGGHIVPVLGKEAMVAPAAICTTLEHPFFCILDADGQKFGDEVHAKALANLTSIDITKIEQGKD
ncbi:MAG: AAA family ATPase, partial [Prosthecobacter sp.]|nr:AAA family ATPase [Prosthecobacter sp.]